MVELTLKQIRIRRRAMIEILDQKLKENNNPRRKRIIKNLSFEEFESRDLKKQMKGNRLTVVC